MIPMPSTHSRVHKKTLSVLIPMILSGVMMPVGSALADDLADDKEQASLPTVAVEASKADAGTTEGTQSYTTDQMGTATPLGLSPHDTPQSVSVITRQQIEDQHLDTLMDAIDNTTGISVRRYETNRADFSSRGFAISSLMIDGVPTVWDQVWGGGEIFSNLALYDHVEVVRGATGLTSGNGNPAAAINLVRKRANSKTLTGSIEAGLGNLGQRTGTIDVSTPLNESGSIRGRVVGSYQQQDGQEDLYGRKDKTFYGTISADLTANTSLSFGYSRQKGDTESPMWGGLPYWYANGELADWPRSKTTSADWAYWTSTYDSAFVDLTHRLDNGWQLRAAYNYGRRKADSKLLYLYGVPDKNTGLGMGAWPGWYRTSTQQNDIGLSASGNWSLFGREHEAAFGYDYSDNRFNADSRSGALGAAPDFNHWDGSYPEPAWGPWSFYEEEKTRKQAVYGVVRLSLADPLRAIIGARLTNYEQTGMDATGATLYKMKFDHEFTPYFGLIYTINDTYSAYASYTDIFQPQQVRDINGNYLDPILGKSMEAGIKAAYFDGLLNASLSVFRIKQDNLGQSTGQNIPGTTPPETAYVATSGATSKGFEAEVSGEIQPGWNVSAGYSQYSLSDADGSDVNTIYPRRLLRLFTTYQMPGAFSGLTIGGGVNWQSQTWTTATNPSGNSERIAQNSFALVNLMARYQFNRHWSTQLNVSNLLDKKYYGLFDAYNQITYGNPRMVTLTARYKF